MANKFVIETLKELSDAVMDCAPGCDYAVVEEKFSRLSDGEIRREFRVYHAQFGGAGFVAATAQGAFDIFSDVERKARRYPAPAVKDHSQEAPF